MLMLIRIIIKCFAILLVKKITCIGSIDYYFVEFTLPSFVLNICQSFLAGVKDLSSEDQPIVYIQRLWLSLTRLPL